MQQTIDQLDRILIHYTPKISELTEPKLSYKAGPGKWSKREILGHLIDSAQNNIRRFIVTQYEQVPTISYDQNEWVELSDYQHAPWQDLLNLWVLLNKQICRILIHCPLEACKRMCDTRGPEPVRLDAVATDYVRHLLHHLHQLLDMEPVAYP
jgi:hypothetical protein